MRAGTPGAWGGAASVLVFLALALAVHARWLIGLDLALTPALQRFAGPQLDALAGTISIAFSFEAVSAYAAMAALLLWRRGAGLWALAPFSFLGLTAVELAFKLYMPTDPIPVEFHRSVSYPLVEVTFPGAFPSGHALRIGFIGLAAASIIRGLAPKALLLTAAIVAITVVFALSRVYLGNHWLSDVVGGLLLGGALGALVSQSVSAALVRQRSVAEERASEG